jgi:hypothetical protein
VTTDPAHKRFVLVLRTDADGAYRRLRNALKSMLRRDKLRCVSITEEKPETGTPCPAPELHGQKEVRKEK